MKDVNQYRNELVCKITAEVMRKMPELICKKMDQFEIAYDDKIAEGTVAKDIHMNHCIHQH